MPPLGEIARRVTGLPESAGRASRSAPPVDAAAWEAAGAELAAGRRGPGVPAPPAGAPWDAETERSGAVAARRLGRGLVWGVLALAAITGIRSWIVPPRVGTAPQAPTVSAPAYPEAAARAVAARLARAYLTWNQEAPDTRAGLLRGLLPAGSDPAMGWDGHGRQDVLAVEPGPVTLSRAHGARVRVDVLLAGSGPDRAARWIGLDVPVVEAGGRVVVTGQPGLVAVPATGPRAQTPPPAESDSDLSRRTESAVRRFFSAYAAGDTDTATAPGARIPPLPAGIELVKLDSWAIDSYPVEGDRTGTALVTWTLGGAQLQQTYRVTLTRVSSANAARWQVADLKGGQA